MGVSKVRGPNVDHSDAEAEAVQIYGSKEAFQKERVGCPAPPFWKGSFKGAVGMEIDDKGFFVKGM